MQVLVRLVRRRPDGIQEEQDSDLESGQVTVGSAADRDIQLLGVGIAADHAVIARSGREVTITARRDAELLVNGTRCRSARLSPDSVVEIGGHRLALIEAPAGFDLAVRVELSSTVRAADFERAFRTDLTGTWLSQRFASWTLFALVVAFGFAMPFATALMTRSDPALANRSQVHSAGKSGWPAAISDVSWSTGPLTPAHAQATHNNCNICHERFFAAVPDRTCRNCHAGIRDHVDSHHRQIVGASGQQTCGQCHREHDAARGSLVNRADRLCVGCHGDSSVSFESVSLEHVRQFASGGHPEFKATLLQASQAPGRSVSETTWRSIRVALAKASQQSNLTFSHEAHLAGAPVTRQGLPLKCRDCHVLAADGASFAPITMAGACASCHSLTFDEEVTDRQLPHGNPQAAVAMLEDYYVRKAVDPARAVVQVRRLLPDRTQRDQGCTAATLDCGLRNANNAVQQLFDGDRGCAECHRIEDSHRGPDTERFAVAPVRLTQDFFPDMHFSHRAHQVQKDLTGDAACEACHDVRHSKSSADVKLPGLDRCLQCHADTVKADRVELRCVSCHVYHPMALDTNTEEPGVAQR